MLTEQQDRELKAQDDGRLQYLSVQLINNVLEYTGSFNISPYTSTPITKKQYENYKKICKPKFQYCQGNLIEFWSCGSYDNGLPKWFNKLF